MSQTDTQQQYGTDDQQDSQQSAKVATRRGLMGALAAGITLPALIGRASAQSGNDPGAACTWLGDVDAAGYALHSLEGVTFIDGGASDLDVPNGQRGLAVNSSQEIVKKDPDGDTTVLATKGNGGLAQVATGTVTATGGSSPAVNTTLAAVSTDQLINYRFPVFVDADPAWNADYAFNYDYSHRWDDSAQEFDIELTVNWDIDPGAGNDLTLRWEVLTY